MNPGIVAGIVVGVLALLLAAGITIWVIMLVRKSVRSDPEPGVPVADVDSLRAMLLKLNQPGHPFVVHTPDDADLSIEWHIVDARWVEALGSAALQMTYRAWLRLDDASKTVKLHERLIQSGISAGGGLGASSEGYTTKGLDIWARRRGYRWGIREDFSVGEIFSYQFTPADVKDLVRQIANDHGWAFQLTFTKPRPTHPPLQSVEH